MSSVSTRSDRSHLSNSSVAASTKLTARHSNRKSRQRPLRSIGNWQLTQLAGCGSFTDVYLAQPKGCRPNWPADYAIKILRPKFVHDRDAIELLRREAEVASQVSHQHLVTILEAHLSGDDRYLVMPKLAGVSVAQIIERVGYLSVRQSLWITRQVSEALDALHRRKWLHGDVKPDNIMLSKEGHATLVDLGFSLRFSEAMLTEFRTVKGTLNYVAPETMTSAHCSDQRSDIYSLGISLFRMLTGRLPFAGKNASELIEAHRGKPIPDPREFNRNIPGSVVSLLSRMTAKQPLRRPQCVRELAIKLLPLEVAAMKAERSMSRIVG